MIVLTSNTLENTATGAEASRSKRRSRFGMTIRGKEAAAWYDSNEFSGGFGGKDSLPAASVAPFQESYGQIFVQSQVGGNFGTQFEKKGLFYLPGSNAAVGARDEGGDFGGFGGRFDDLGSSPSSSQASCGRSLSYGSVGAGFDGCEGSTAVSEGCRVAARDSYFRNVNFQTILEQCFGVPGVATKNENYAMFKRGRSYMFSRGIVDELRRQKLERRREWNQWRGSDSVLDFFPTIKYAHSSLIPQADRIGFTDIKINSKGKVRFDNVARSHSIRLDPIDAPFELFKYRCRINRCINWAYKTGLVPVMMTLTIYHRWHDLEPLCRALQQAWTKLFSGGAKGTRRREYIGLQGFVRRMEETLNDNDTEFNFGNSGWHPHYHVILFIPREKLEVLSNYERQLKEVWLELTCKYFKQEVGESIPEGFYDAIRKHGLVLSRYSKKHRVKGKRVGDLYEVKDSRYLAKIMGYDPEKVYGVDKEMASFNLKKSKIPFDLLCGEWTANKADLWCEYAIATKAIPCFTFSYGLEKTVNEYYKAHPEEESEAGYSPYKFDASDEKVIAHIDKMMYKFLFQCGLLDEAAKVATQGYEALEEWFKPYQEKFYEYLGFGMWKPCDVDTDNESDDAASSGEEKVSESDVENTSSGAEGISKSDNKNTSPGEEEISAENDKNNASDSQNMNTTAEKSEPEPNFDSMSDAELLYYRFGYRDEKLTGAKSDNQPSDIKAEPPPSQMFCPPPPPTKITPDSTVAEGEARLREIDEEIKAFFDSLESANGIKDGKNHPPPPSSVPVEPEESSTVSDPPADCVKEKISSDQGISLPFSQEKEPPSPPPEPEKSSISAEDLAIAEKLDRPGILPPEIKLTPLVSKGLPLTEALKKLRLPSARRKIVLMMIEHFRKEVAEEAKRKSRAESKELAGYRLALGNLGYTGAGDYQFSEEDYEVLPHLRNPYGPPVEEISEEDKKAREEVEEAKAKRRKDFADNLKDTEDCMKGLLDEFVFQSSLKLAAKLDAERKRREQEQAQRELREREAKLRSQEAQELKCQEEARREQEFQKRMHQDKQLKKLVDSDMAIYSELAQSLDIPEAEKNQLIRKHFLDLMRKYQV